MKYYLSFGLLLFILSGLYISTKKMNVNIDFVIDANASFDEDTLKIPDDVKYAVIGIATNPNINKNMDVRLNRKVSKKTLRVIALELRDLNANSYDNIVINYYLQVQEVGHGAWATARFNPDLEIEILGLSSVDEERLNNPQYIHREVIGKWIDDTPNSEGILTLFRENSKVYLEIMHKDGSSDLKEMSEHFTSLGFRFDEKPKNPSGEFYSISNRGNLQIVDIEVIIKTYKKIED